MDRPVFYDLAKKFHRNLRYTARFYPVDLHCHTPLSPCFGRKDGISQDDIQATADQIAIAGCKKGIYVIAITDHHRCENAQEIADACQEIRSAGENLYPNNNLIVLPGMEISVEENSRNVHLLAIFPENCSPIEIERILYGSGIESNPIDRSGQSRVTTKRLIEIVKAIRELNGLAILAHVNSTNGYREEMRSIGKSDDEILEDIFKLKIHAVEVSKPEDMPHFSRDGIQLPCIIGSDAHYLEEIGGKEYTTRVKMTKPSFIDLARAFQDPETRIKFKAQKRIGIKKILGIRFDGGFLDQQVVPLTSNLNCLIGGRGTGKSSCIEAIRYVFDKQIPIDRQKDIIRLRDNVLSGCSTQIIYEDQNGEKYVLNRTYGDHSTKIFSMEGFDNNDIDLKTSHNLRLNFYGWSEIEGIAQDPKQQLTLIDSFIDGIDQIKTEEINFIRILKGNAREIISTIERIDQEASKVGNLQELVQELKTIGEDQQEEEINKEKIDTERELLKDVLDRIGDLYSDINDVKIEKEISTVFRFITKAIDDKKVLFIKDFKDIKKILIDSVKEDSSLIAAINNLLSELSNIINDVKRKVAGLEKKQDPIDAVFQRFLEKFEQAEAKKVAKRREQLRKEIRERKKAQQAKEKAINSLNELEAKRTGLLKDLIESRNKLYEVRNGCISEIAEKLPKGKESVEIALGVVAQGERNKFIELLNKHLKRLPKQWHAAKFPERLASYFTPIDFVKAIRTADITSFVDAGFTKDEGVDIINHLDGNNEKLMELEVCECTDLPKIYFNVQGQKKPIEDLSPGQRCTALLPIILLETDTPLIIDQPEDNLDNQFIFDLVVNTIRKLKESRQIIVATHNPNIPVSGDAENILVFKPSGAKGALARNGSIDYGPIIEDVKKIMEGGEKAFVVRQKKYNL